MQVRVLGFGETHVLLLQRWTWRNVASTSVCTYLSGLIAPPLPPRKTRPPVLLCLYWLESESLLPLLLSKLDTFTLKY